MIDLKNIDCMEYLKGCSDNQFDLAIVDPPYGIGMDGIEWNNTPKGEKSIKGYTKGLKIKKKGWDKIKPSREYWHELFRVSKNQIVWGGNYFTAALKESRCWIVWDKKQPDGVGFSKAELAWTSFSSICEMFRMYPTHVAQGPKIHPTQKPVALYKWLLTNYAKEGDSILDTHLGSGSIAIACHDLKFDLVGCELDKEYFDAACKRLEVHQRQLTLF